MAPEPYNKTLTPEERREAKKKMATQTQLEEGGTVSVIQRSHSMPGTSQSMHAPPGQQEGDGHHQERNEWAGFRFDPYTGRPMGNPGGGDPGPGDGGDRGGGGGGGGGGPPDDFNPEDPFDDFNLGSDSDQQEPPLLAGYLQSGGDFGMPPPRQCTDENYKEFLEDLIIYFEVKTEQFKDQSGKISDVKKIFYTLRFMNEGKAKYFAINFRRKVLYDDHGRLRIALPKGSWTKFLDRFQNYMEDPEKQAKAHQKMVNTKQGGRTAESYFEEFMRLAWDAGYVVGNDDSKLISVLKINLDEWIRIEIAKKIPQPKSFHDWKKIATQLDQSVRDARKVKQQSEPPPRRQYQAPAPQRYATPQQKNPTWGNQYRQQQNYQAPREPPPVPAAPAQPPIPHTRFEADGDVIMNKQKMANAKCYSCGQTGHFKRWCPERVTPVRQLLMEMTPEDRQLWANLSTSLPESAFPPNEHYEVDFHTAEE